MRQQLPAEAGSPQKGISVADSEEFFRAHLEHGPCWICGAETFTQCDVPACAQWFCDDHGAIEAQAWDWAGADGVDLRCQDHLSRSFATRDTLRGQYLPPPGHEPASHRPSR